MSDFPFKLGKREVVHPYGLSDLNTYAVGKMPSPPASCQYGSTYGVAGWGMFANNLVGDCTIAGAAHLLMGWNSEVGVNITIPSTQEAETQYFDLTGGQDTGLVETNVLNIWGQSGLFGGPKIAGYTLVQTTNITQLHQAIAFYGGVYLGIQCPQSAQQQFVIGKESEWTVVPGSPIEGGHCIVGVGFTKDGLICVTWGQIVLVTYPFLARYLEEAYAIISPEFIQANKGPLLDLKTLQADLHLI